MISLNVEEALLLNSGRLPAASPSLRPGGVGGHTGLRQPPGGTSGATSTPGATTEDNLKKQIQLGQLLLSSVNCIFYNSDHVWCFSSSIICLLKSGQVKAIAQPGAQSYLSYSKFSKRDIGALQHVEKWNTGETTYYETIKLLNWNQVKIVKLKKLVRLLNLAGRTLDLELAVEFFGIHERVSWFTMREPSLLQTYSPFVGSLEM